MTIHHVLKDGQEVDSIAGIVIKASEHQALYEVINRIQKKEGEAEDHEAV